MRRALTLGIAVALFALTVSAQESQLGRVEFPTSGSEKAQQHFLRGLAALHSFWYEEAIEAFRESTKVDPDFAMGYWGEAMAYNHPLWSEQDIATARQVLAKIKETPKLTERERAYVAAVRVLYGEGDKHARDVAYSAAMEKVYRAYPDDLDAAAFYALSLLGIGGEKGYRLQAKAGAIALDVYQKNPNHPGAAHYIIHAFDDPDHAILALPAARRYASIAPEAHHARHMPSHIFLQLGMWPEAAASNEAAWEASDAWMKRKSLSLNVRDYHSLHWLLYVYLQQGRYNDAEKLLTMMKKVMSESTYDNKLRPGYYENNYANMAAAFVVETERWNLATGFFPDYRPVKFPTEQTTMTGAHGQHGTAPTLRTSWANRTLPLLIRGLAGVMTGNEDDAVDGLDELGALQSKADAGKTAMAIGSYEISALAASMKKDHDKAIEFMKKATALEEDMRPPSGPPSLIKPTHELFGEILLRAGKPAEAAEMFKVSLQRQPNRARSLLGAARAATQTGNQSGALTAYAALVDQWKQADTGLSELREARDYLKQAKR